MDGYNSPDRGSNAYFPHDLDDIYEYKTDHQYFTHTGTPNNNERFSISSDEKRNAIFRNSNIIHSLDDNGSRELAVKTRFDNSSFIRSLNSAISQNSVDSGNHTGSSNNNSKEKISKSHHHHSIHEMIKHFGKKVHIWPRNRHDSINENEISSGNRQSSCHTPEPEVQEKFRSRSKSLDVNLTRKVLDDCESTYKIYNRILKEGN